jgi:hypothetical protein
MRAVGDIDPPLPDGWQGGPDRMRCQQVKVFQGTLNRKTAAGHKHDFGTCISNFFPGERPGRDAGPSQYFFTTSQMHQFWTPVPAGKRRMKPFQQSYPWTPVNRGAAARNGFHTRLQPGDDFFGYGLPPGSSSHLMQAGEDFRQGLGFEIDDVWVTGQVAGGSFDFFFGDGADITQRLRHDHVRLQGFEDRQVESVERMC